MVKLLCKSWLDKMAKYDLTTQAQLSLEEIKVYSIENFGQQQTSIYFNSLRDRMVFLSANPKLDTERNYN